jgi:hypothetical protein
MREHLALAIEDFLVDLILGIVHFPIRVYSTCREVARLFVESFDGAPGGRHVFESELAELIAPHLSVLAHKRARMFVEGDEGAMQRWSLELRCYIDCSVLPLMGAERAYADRNRGLVAEILDRIVEREQHKPAERSCSQLLPSVIPFDSSWAT